jgi:alcohol dehydrogenase, propanol-preferring
MRAMVLTRQCPVEQRPLRLETVPSPAPCEDEVLIRLHYCGICRTDLHVTEGELPRHELPIVPGHQAVGEVVRSGDTAKRYAPGARVGVAWLHRTCGICEQCRHGHENLCPNADFTGYTVNGGFAEYITAPEAFVYPIPAGFNDLAAAPLLCAGIIGFRSLRLADLHSGDTLGIYGFGAAGHVCIQVARHWGVRVFVATREQKHRELAAQLGAEWVGGAYDNPPELMNAAIIFAPAGELVPTALSHLKYGGTLVLGGIHMSPIPTLAYDLLYHERIVRSVANNTRQDGTDFIRLAAEIPVQTTTRVYPLERANDALCDLKHDNVQGAAVLQIFA